MLFEWPMCLSGVYLRKENEAKKIPRIALEDLYFEPD
jgi:hypothetical protein